MITNNYNLPRSLVEAIKNDSYSPGDSDITVTQLIGPPMIRYLRKKYSGEITEDAADRLWSLYGQAAHHILERAGLVSELNEERLYMFVNGWTIGGQLDNLCLLEGVLSDYKMTSIWAVKGDIKPEWEAQLNVLAQLCRLNGFPVEKLQIIALLKDWRRTESLRYNDYPPVPVKVVDIPLWEEERVKKYIFERVLIHQKEPVPCTPEERWHKPDKFAVMKKGRKTAVRVLDSDEEAEAYITEKEIDTGYIVHRPGEDTRCESYCEVAKVCPCNHQDKSYNESNT